MESIGWTIALLSTVAAAWFALQRQRLQTMLANDRAVVAQAEADADAAEQAAAATERRARRDLDRLSWVMAVDARGPVISARGHLTTLRRTREERMSSSERNLLSNAIGDIDLAVRLLDDARSWAQTTLDEPELHVVDLRVPLDTAIAELDHDRRATLDVQPLPSVTTDPALLATALLAVLDNCVRYRWPDEPVHIRVTGDEVDGRAELRIADDGLGVELEDTERLFLPFTRGDGSAAMPGVGLGLAVARRAVEALGGTIGFAPHEGRGATVVITLPGV